MKSRIFLIIAVFVLVACGSKPVREPPAPLTALTPAFDITQLWSVDVGAESDEAASLTAKVAGESIYAADPEGRVSAYDVNTGRSVWTKSLDVKLGAGVGVGEGLVLVVSRKGEIIALDVASGERQWRATAPSETSAPPVVASGIVVIQTLDGKLTGYTAKDGKRLWVNERSEPALSLRGTGAPVVQGDAVIAGFANGKLSAVTLRDGRTLWEATLAQPRGRNEIERLVDVDATPLAMPDAIYAASYQGKLAAFNPRTGAIGWSRDVSTYSGIASDGSYIFLTDENGRVLAFDRRNGSAPWSQQALHGRRLSAPVVYRDFVVVGDFEGYVHWLTRSDGRIVARYRVGSDAIATPIVVASDTLFVLNRSGTLAALRPAAR